ncbi:MAG: GntR family transcriptional regulator [Pseudonocardiaceae bacterium]
MARYLEIGTEIAQRVRSGELPAGTELPAIRESAREHATTSSTVGRAYRYLADGEVITLAKSTPGQDCHRSSDRGGSFT